MSFSVKDPIIGPSRGSAAVAKRYAKDNGAANLAFCEDYIDEVYALCTPDDMPDAAIAIAQSVHETTDQGRPWFSYWWRQRGNPAGMGITGDPDQNERSPTFASGAQAAQAQVAHLLLYATGKVNRGGLVPAADPRYAAYVDAYGNTVQARTIAGLTGKWGVDQGYADGVVNRAIEVFPETPAPGGRVVFGRVPHPAMEIRDIPSSVNTAWNDLGPRTIRGIVWHRSIGYHQGNDQYFRDTGPNGGARRALTDYGIGVAAADGASLAGSIYRWNDPRGRRSPWANGPVNAPYGDGKAFVDRYGINATQRDLASVEISGFQETPLDEKSRQALCELTAYWADQYKVSWETFPLIPSEGNRSFVLWHQELTIGTGKECPFKVVMDDTDALIARTKEILRRYQAQTPTTTTTSPPTPSTTTTPPPAPQPEPQPKPQEPELPKGLSTGVLEALFNPLGVKNPKTGGNVGFNWNGGLSRAWFDQAVATIPDGGDWKQGNFCPLISAVKRGDGRVVWQFSNWVHETE